MNIVRVALLLGLFLQAPFAHAEEVTLVLNGARVRAEVADTPQSRKHGLMNRTHLCANCGMLFVFERANQYNFWMKNTYIPLSIAFIAADGSILNTDEMQPLTTTLHPAQGEALYALEMNRGWFEKNGIHSADKVQGLPKATAPRP